MKRRIGRNATNGACIGGGLGFTIDLISQINAIMSMGHPLNWQNFKTQYNPQQALQNTLVGIGIGAGIGLAYSLLTGEEEKNDRFNQNQFLNELLAKSKVDPKSKQSQSDRKVVSKVCDFLATMFADRLLGKPLPAGSSARRTAIHPVSDYDIAFILRPEAGTLAELQESFYNVLSEKFAGPGCTVRQQNRSVGVLLDRPDGTTLKIDVLPARARGDYSVTGDLTIWDRRRQRPLKTNVGKHNRMTVGQPQARDTIRLLKLYKDANGLPLPTPLLNQLVPTGLGKRGGHSSLAENLRFSIGHVAQKLNNQFVKDTANGNNNLYSSMTPTDKLHVQTTLLDDLDRWSSNPRHLKTMFSNALN